MVKINRRTMTAGLRTIMHASTMPELPFHINIEPTTQCNYKCRMCWRRDSRDKPQHFPIDRFEPLIRRMKPWFVSLNGVGETLLHPHFFDMVNILSKQGIEATTTSNGSLLGRHIEEIIASDLRMISISLDAATSEMYEFIRGSKKHAEILSSIRELIRMRGSRLFPVVRASFVLMKENIHEIELFVRLAKDTGIQGVLFQPFFEIGPEDNRYDGRDSDAVRNEIVAHMKSALETAGKFKVPTNLHFLIRKFDDFYRVQYERAPHPQSLRKCPKPWISLYISATGDAVPCCSIPASDYVLGNVFESDPLVLFNNEKMRDFRNKLKQSRPPHWICDRCMPLSLADMITQSVW